MVSIKICGLRRAEDIAAANTLLPDYIGFVFAKSRRMVTAREACRLRERLCPKIGAVGVFVNALPEQAAQTARVCRLSAVQLHGDEDGSHVKTLRALLPGDCEIWKAARVKNAEDIAAAAKTGADRLLLDAFGAEARGGTGKIFDWALLSSGAIDRPFFVAGGITVQNVREAVQAAKAAGRPFGIDVSGGVETDGFKDFYKMQKIIQTIRIL